MLILCGANRINASLLGQGEDRQPSGIDLNEQHIGTGVDLRLGKRDRFRRVLPISDPIDRDDRGRIDGLRPALNHGGIRLQLRVVDASDVGDFVGFTFEGRYHAREIAHLAVGERKRAQVLVVAGISADNGELGARKLFRHTFGRGNKTATQADDEIIALLDTAGLFRMSKHAPTGCALFWYDGQRGRTAGPARWLQEVFS